MTTAPPQVSKLPGHWCSGAQSAGTTQPRLTVTYLDRVDEEPVVIKLTHDQAFVLSDWLYEVMMKSDKLDAIVPDRAVWSGIYAISGTLEKSLVEIFMPDYGGRLEQARQRLLDAVGGDEDEEAEATEGVSREPSVGDISS
ncbi:hypothetical protein GCM10010271_43800 [Streptomyces kurssanovii]|nr:hypothetical protein GCM10010271_43800 [Streptomyces kurssanovii]